MNDKIIKLLEEKGHLSFKDIALNLGISEVDLASKIAKIENILIYKDKKDYYLIDNKNICSGTILFKGNNALIKDNNGKTYLLDSTDKKIYPGDRFLFQVYEYNGKEYAILNKFVSHSKQQILAITSKSKRNDYRLFRANLEGIGEIKFKAYDYPSSLETYDLVLIEPLYYKDGAHEVCRFIKKVSNDFAKDKDILNLIIQSGVPFEFDDNYYEEIKNVNDHVLDQELEGRLDLTNKIIFTIDGDDSKDFDDAVSLERDGDIYHLGVHIADVSHYVKEGSLIDKEALKRGTSIYLADRVIPMLDYKLSNGICSLSEGNIRLTLSVLADVDKNGNIVNREIAKSYICSKRRMTYSNCNKMFDGDLSLINKYQDIYPTLEMMKDLSLILRNKRKNNGSIFFETKEFSFDLDNNFDVIGLKERKGGLAENLIEEFMLVANQVVAKTLFELNYPAIYRVHESPDVMKLKEVEPLINANGLKLHFGGAGIKSRDIQNVLDELKDSPSYQIITDQLLRAMTKAYYSPNCIGHFGLSFIHYLHFTSPIRRYPDLMVHRIITNLITNPKSFNKDYNHFELIVSEIANQNSISERKALDLERAVIDLEICKYMKKFMGHTFTGVISSIMPYGAYIELDNGVEGLAHVNNMADYMEYNEAKKELFGYYTEECYNIGDSVTVRLIDVNFSIRKLDFLIIGKNKRKKNEVNMSK